MIAAILDAALTLAGRAASRRGWRRVSLWALHLRVRLRLRGKRGKRLERRNGGR